MKRLLLLAVASGSLWGQLALHADLAGAWKTSSASQPEMARPDYDDSLWPSTVLPPADPAGAPAGWLRKRVDLPPEADGAALALTLGPLRERYAVYVNGVPIAQVGSFDTFSGAEFARTRTFPIPAEAIGSSRQLLIAIRVAPPARTPFEFRPDQTAPYLLTFRGNAPVLSTPASFAARRERHFPSLVIAALFLAMTIPLALAWRGDRHRTDLLWLAAFLAASALKAAHAILSMTPGAQAYNSGGSLVIQGLLRSSAWLLLLSFVVATFRPPFARVSWAAWCGWLVHAVRGLLGHSDAEGYRWLGLMAMGAAAAVISWAGWKAVAERAPPRTHLLVLLLASMILERNLSLRRIWTGGGLERFVPIGSWYVSASDFLTLLLASSILAVLLRQTANDRRERQRLRTEMEAGRVAQTFLLGDSEASRAKGMDAAYVPAAEVGGDFYWSHVTPGGGLLLVVGDVSGKGLKAAMLVPVAIGILRNEKSTAPGTILAALNDGLVGNSEGGFVTCCCAHFEASGLVTLANAGHLPPYCDGQEVAVEGGLPLGVVPGVAYREYVADGAAFTFISDGVVEAENAQRELFGFDRAREISGKSAREIAEAARRWGQNDDITVVTVRRNA